MNRVQAKYAVPHGGRMSEPKYWSEAGQTKHNDPTRLVWFGPCGYWTDDWSVLRTPGGGFKMPICPLCGAPGFQQEYRDFMKRSPGEKEWCWETLGEPPKSDGSADSSLSQTPRPSHTEKLSPKQRKKEKTMSDPVRESAQDDGRIAYACNRYLDARRLYQADLEREALAALRQALPSEGREGLARAWEEGYNARARDRARLTGYIELNPYAATPTTEWLGEGDLENASQEASEGEPA